MIFCSFVPLAAGFPQHTDRWGLENGWFREIQWHLHAVLDYEPEWWQDCVVFRRPLHWRASAKRRVRLSISIFICWLISHVQFRLTFPSFCSYVDVPNKPGFGVTLNKEKMNFRRPYDRSKEKAKESAWTKAVRASRSRFWREKLEKLSFCSIDL